MKIPGSDISAGRLMMHATHGGALTAAALWAVALITGAAGTAAAQSKPNIAVIVVDDLDVASLSTMVSAGMMPNLKQYIIDRGVTFRQSFVSNGHGCPARGTLFTGLYSHNFLGASAKCSAALFNDQNTLATWLHNGGYQTALIGRYMDGYGYTDINHDGLVDSQDALYIPPGWDNWQAFVYPNIPAPNGIVAWYENANMYNYLLNDNGKVVTYGNTPEEYQVDVLAQRAASYITSVAGGSAPFFLFLAPTAPHIEVFPDPETMDDYPDAWLWDIRPPQRYAGTIAFPLPMLPSFNETDVSDKPLWVQQKPVLTSTNIANLTRQYQNRLASLRAVDDLIGSVANALNSAGKLQNTVLIFTSDNGWFSAQHRLSEKMAAYEEAIRIPLYIGQQGPKSVVVPVTNVDLAPTIAALAGITPGGPVDGMSLVPLLSNPNQAWRKRFLLENWVSTTSAGTSVTFSVPSYYAVRTGPNAVNVPNQLYVAYGDSGIEFYDFAADPFQLANLALDPSPLRVQQRGILSQALLSMKTCGNGSCQTIEMK